MDRVWAFLTALVLGLCAAGCAMADTDYPPFQGIVADVAGVLGEKTVSDLQALSDRLESSAGSHVYVLTRHFLGGADATTYAQKVFEVWGLGEQDALLLMVIGEESYALTVGPFFKTVLGAETLNSLLATQFRTAFLNREYDEAAAGLAVSLGQAMAKAVGDTLDVSGLFGRAAVQSTPQPQSWNEIFQGMFAQDDYQEESWNWDREWNDEETHVNWRGIIIWALVIYFLFFRRKRHRR